MRAAHASRRVAGSSVSSMAVSNPDAERPAFHAVAELVLKDWGAVRVLGMSGFASLASVIAPGQPFEPFDFLPDLVAQLGGSDQPTLVFPPWGRHGSDSYAPWEDAAVPAGGLALLVPAGDLSRRLPKGISHLGAPSMVVVGAIDSPASHASFQGALVLFEPEQHETTRFFTLPEKRPVTEVVADLRQLLKQRGGSTAFGFVHRGRPLAGQSLRPKDHDPKIEAQIEDLAGFGTGGLMSDVFDVLQAHPRRTPGEPHGRVVTGRDLGPDGRLIPLDADDGAPPRERRGVVPLREGDFVMSRIERSPRPPVEITSGDLPLAAGSSLVVLRPKIALSHEHREFYGLYLQSRRLRDSLRGESMAGAAMLTGLAGAPLPVPDADLLEAMADLRRARDSFASWAEESFALGVEAFEGPATESRRRLITRGRSLRQRAEAAQAVGTFEHRVANFYPHPIAAQFRHVRVSESAGDNDATYSAILDSFETTLAFCAALALAFARHNEVPVQAMKEVSSKLSKGKRGVGIGDWAVVLKEVSSGRAFRSIDSDAPLATIRLALPEGSPAAKAQERLKDRRDAESHQRGVDEIDLGDAVRDAMEDLELLLDHLGFLADLPIVQIESSRWDSLQGEGLARVRSLRGDHPMGLIESLPHVQPDLEVGSLYVKDLNGKLLLLRPFLVRHQCPTCRTWSTFCPDHRREGQLLLKALDHSHTIEACEHISALKAVGYVNEGKFEQ